MHDELTSLRWPTLADEIAIAALPADIRAAIRRVVYAHLRNAGVLPHRAESLLEFESFA